MKNLIAKWNNVSLVKRIIVGLIIGIILAVTVPVQAQPVTILGSLFVGALKGIAPVLVFFLVMAAISSHKSGQKTNMGSIVKLYALATFLAGATAVIVSFMFPVTITLAQGTQELSAPGGIGEVLKALLLNLVENPVKAIVNANYLGILAWALVFGLALRHAQDTTKAMITNVADAVTTAVRWVISFAPFGILGLVFDAIATSGLGALVNYGKLLLVLLGTMFFMALVIYPLLVFINLRTNPYPLVLKCLKDSGITAFFTRSSAANIPVNMKLCEDLGLDKDTYSVSIPLGSTVNMGEQPLQSQ